MGSMLLLGAGGKGAASAPPFIGASFDGVTSSQVTLSNGNLTATVNSSTNNIGARSTALKSTGKYYFEMTATKITGNSMGFGMLTAAGTYVNMINDATNCLEVIPTGTIISNNSSTGRTTGAYVTGDVLCFAVDLGTRKGWVRKNGGNWNGLAIGSENPATGTGGVTILPTVSFSPAVAFGGGAPPITEAGTGNFGSTAFAQSVPSGFTAGWPA